MTLLGCLPVLLLVVLLLFASLIGKGLQFVLSIVRLLGDAVLWIWGSLCNLFLPLSRQRRVYNPFKGTWNIEAPVLITPDATDAPTEKGAKLYDARDGEYTDFEELPSVPTP